MGYSLAIYGNQAFREIILPQTSNVDYVVLLARDIFGFTQDVQIIFENTKGQWYFEGADKSVRIRSTGLKAGEKLLPGTAIHLRQEQIYVDILVSEVDQNLNRFKKYNLNSSCSIRIGAGDGCDIEYNFQGLVSRNHAILNVQPGSCTVIDCSRNGVYMDCRRIQTQQTLRYGDQVNIFGLQIIWLGNVLAVGTTGQPVHVSETNMQMLRSSNELFPNGYHRLESVAKRTFHRSPRMLPKLHTEQIEIEAVPQPTHTAKRPLLLTIGPSMTMVIPMLLGSLIAILAASSSGGAVSPYMFTGIVIAAAAGALGVMWALLNLRYTKRTERETEENRVLRYQQYLYEIETEIAQKTQDNKQMLEAAYPSVSVCAKNDMYAQTLWNRNTSHPDMLFVRLGIGESDFQCPIVVPKRRFSLYDDPLADRPGQIRQTYQTMQGVPVGIDLRKRSLVGVAGDGSIAPAMALARAIAIQLSACCAYTDLKFVFLGRSEAFGTNGAWSFAKWLPHVWSEGKSFRYCAGSESERAEVCFELSEIMRARMERTTAEGEEGGTYPHYIVFVEAIDLLENSGLLKQLIATSARCGFTTLILAPRRELLPNICEDILETNGTHCTVYNLSDDMGTGNRVQLDSFTSGEADHFARSIAGVEVSEIESNGAIPDTITFFEMWGVKTLDELQVADRWRKNRTYETLRALIGKKAGGEDWYLDVHEKHHGPHGLIAGTTGSGKSETLQTFILSLALSYSPDDVSFFIIDYKGGGMANLFSNLPHIAGQITNLSGNQVHRAMVSIMSENRRRQRLFNECGVNHIDSYTRLYKDGETSVPLPHLLIIIDEFAELKKEESSFMRELISVAQVGRSLGVHLILATQKPSGTVDDNIWSNAKFRLCLRVQDRQDSNEMLHKPDAAYITHTGRGFMQVGNDEIYEEFQSGWSGADYDEALAQVNTNIASMHTLTGKPAIIGNYLKKQQKDRQRIQFLGTLAAFFRSAEQEHGIRLADVISDREDLNRLIETIYRLLQDAHIDYPKSRNNTARLESFAQELAAEGISNWSDEALLRQIIHRMQTGNGKLPEIRSKTQLSAIVDYLAETAIREGYRQNTMLWLPVLPEKLYLPKLEEYCKGRFDGTCWQKQRRTWSLEAIIGLSDHPANQMQSLYRYNFTESGNLAICGSAGSGKSTFVQTLLFSLADHYSPDELNLYVLDFSNRSLGSFFELPHCGGVVFDDEPEKLARFFIMISDMVRKRRQILSGGTFSQYVQVNGAKLPALVIAIDNYAGFREKTDGAYEMQIQTLAREGVNYGVFFVITAGGFGGADIPSRLADNLRGTICLELGDKFKYGDVLRTIHFDVFPEAGVKGRGIASIQGNVLEFQTALPVETADDFSRGQMVSAYFRRMREAWTGKLPRKIPEIPNKPDLATLSSSEDYKAAVETGKLLPCGYHPEDASLYCIELSHTFCYLITGKPGTGKTTLLQVLMSTAHDLNGSLCVADFCSNRLQKSAAQAGAEYVCNAEMLFNYTRGLQAEFLARNKEKQALLRDGAEEDEIFEKISKQHTPVFLMIDDLGSFVREVYQAENEYPGVRAFFENAIDKGSLHHIYFIACVDTSALTQLSGKTLYERMISYKTGIHLGGNVAQQRILDFNAMPFMEQAKTLKPGIGLLPQDIEHPAPRRVILPRFRGVHE